MGASAGVSGSARRRKTRGRHRAKRNGQHISTWLGAGAVTLGVGAALAAAPGVAQADAGSESSTNASASSANDSQSSSRASDASQREAADTRQRTLHPARTDDSADSDAESDTDFSERGSEENGVESKATRVEDNSATQDSDDDGDEADLDPVTGVAGTDISSVDEGAHRSARPPQPPQAAPAAIEFTTAAVGTAVADDAPSTGDAPLNALVPVSVLSSALPPNPSAKAGRAAPTAETSASPPDQSAPDHFVMAAAVPPFEAPKVAIVDSYQLTGAAGSTTTSPGGRYVYVATGNAIDIVDTQTDKVTRVSIPDEVDDVAAAGSYIVTVNYRPNRPNGMSGTMTVIDAGTRKVLRTFPVSVGNYLANVTLSSDGRTAYVFSHNGKMGVVDTRTGTLKRTVDVGAYLHDATAVEVHGNRAYIARDDSPTGKSLSVVNLSTGAVTEVPLPGSSRAVAISRDGKQVYVATSSSALGTDAAIAIINATNNTIVTTIRGSADPQALGMVDIVVGASGRYVYTTSYTAGGYLMSVIDARSHAIVDRVDFEGRPSEMTLSRDGRFIYLADSKSNGAATLYAVSTTVGDPNFEDTWRGLATVGAIVQVLDRMVEKLNSFPTVWRFDGLLRFKALNDGVTSIMEGVTRGDLPRIVTGIADVVTAILPKPAAAAIEIGKAIISIVLPLSNEESEKFLNFRAQCMFHKNADQMSPSEAKRFTDRYGGVSAIWNIPFDYARYNVGGWFGSPSC